MTSTMWIVGTAFVLLCRPAVGDADAPTAANTVAPPAVVSPATNNGAECNTWLDGRDFTGEDISDGIAADNQGDCLALCRQTPGCNAMSYILPPHGSLCYLKKIVNAQAPDTNFKTVTLLLCDDDPDIAAEDIPLKRWSWDPNEGDTDSGECGQWLDSLEFAGSDIEDEGATDEVSKEDCLRRCFATPGCNAVSYIFEANVCYIKKLEEKERATKQHLSAVLRVCPPDSKNRVCGKWLIGEDLFQGTIENSSGINVDQDSCLSRCHDTPECNAVVFKPGSKQCWVKNSPPDDVPLLDTHSESYALCEGEQPGQGGQGSSRGVGGEQSGGSNNRTVAIIASSVAAVALLMCCAAAMCCFLLFRSHKKQRKHVMLEKCLPVDVKGHIMHLEASSAASRGWKGATTGKVLTSISDSSTSHKAVSMPKIHHRDMAGSMFTTEGQTSLAYTSTTAFREWGKERHSFLQSLNKNSSQDATWPSVAGGQGNQRGPFELVSPSHVTAMPMPPMDATKDQIMEFLHNQLDRIELSKDPVFNEILGGLVLLGSMPPNRLQGGQAIVQMAQHKTTKMEYAIKFFIIRSAFLQEKSLYVGESPITQFLPQVRNIEDNENGAVVDTAGYPLPPCIVMERGESLDLYSERNAPDRATVFVLTVVQIIYHIAQRLVELHAMGFVHRDLKPANVMWLPHANRWTVIDFGCVANKGDTCHVACTLRYAAPEVIEAKREGRTMVVDDSIDAWSLGVMAFELATGGPTFPSGPSSLSRERMMDQIEGVNGEMLPWEGERLSEKVQGQMRLFKGALLQLLHRDPSQRPSMQEFCRTCAHVLGDGGSTTTLTHRR